jgi:hypothetical protein
LQADYTIPQATDYDAEVPKTEDGEDLGVGGGWWHTSIFSFPLLTMFIFLILSLFEVTTVLTDVQ